MRRACVLRQRVVQLAVAVAMTSPALAQDEEPSLEFLEYLGSWEEGDEAWYVEVQMEESNEDDKEIDGGAPKELRAERDND